MTGREDPLIYRLPGAEDRVRAMERDIIRRLDEEYRPCVCCETRAADRPAPCGHWFCASCLWGGHAANCAACAEPSDEGKDR